MLSTGEGLGVRLGEGSSSARRFKTAVRGGVKSPFPIPNFFSYLRTHQKHPKKMKDNDWKKRLDIVYSTNPDYHFRQEDGEEETATLAKEKQPLRVSLDKRNRKGKAVTIVTGFAGTDDDLQELGKLLKTKCGVGGSAKDGEIIVQGDHRQKVLEILQKEGYAKSRVI